MKYLCLRKHFHYHLFFPDEYVLLLEFSLLSPKKSVINPLI